MAQGLKAFAIHLDDPSVILGSLLLPIPANCPDFYMHSVIHKQKLLQSRKGKLTETESRLVVPRAG